MTKENAFNQAGFDMLESSYYHRIVFETGRELVGYSKKKGFAEKADKQALLVNMILRMFKSGYLDPENDRIDPVDRIEYWRQNYPDSTYVCTCRYHSIEWNLNNILDYDIAAKKLDKIYADIRDNSIRIVFDKNYIRDKSPITDPFDITVERFRTVADLWMYGLHCIEKKKGSRQQVEHFLRTYAEKHLYKDEKYTILLNNIDRSFKS